MSKTYLGNCACGAVIFEIAGKTETFICHCDSCRKNSGAPFVAWTRISENDFKLLAGELIEYQSSKKVVRRFCKKCGAGISYQHSDSRPDLDIQTVMLHDFDELKPTYHLMVKEKVDWVNVDEEIEQYLEWKNILPKY